jgi:hypothetical protein
MAATKLYLRNTQTISHPAALDGATASPSSAFPAGTDRTTSDALDAAVYDLSDTAGPTATSRGSTTGTTIGLTSARVNTWVSEPLEGQTIAAATWTLGLCARESNASANYFVAGSLYVITPSGTVRGYIYDDATALGNEVATGADPLFGSGTVVTVSGSAVVVSAGDQLVFEWWNTGTQGTTNNRQITSFWNGADEVVDGASMSQPACYISCPNTITFGEAPPAADTNRFFFLF